MTVCFLTIRPHQPIALAGSVFTDDPEDWGSILGRVIPKTQKMVPDATWLNTLHYKLQIKDKVEQSKEGRSAFSYTSV